MKNPFFSIIIPTYNREKFLKIAVDSVLNQTFTDFELIIIDDGSNDNTKQMIAEFANSKIRYIHQEHKGIPFARNLGVKNTKGKYIAFLDSDDRFCKEKLSITHDYIINNNKYKAFYTKEIWYRNGKLISQKEYQLPPKDSAFNASLKLCCISMSTIVINKEIFSHIGYFDEHLLVCEDYDFWLRITHKYPTMLIPKALTIKEGGHFDQESKKYPAMDKFRIYAIEKLLKDNSLSNKNYTLAYQELKNKCLIYITGTLKRNKQKETAYYEDLIKRLEKPCEKILNK